MNRETAALVKRGGGRLGGMGVLPLGEPKKAADEIRGAIGEYGFLGACLPTSAAGVPLDLPQFEDMWDTLEELGLLVFMHATTAITRDTFGPVHPQYSDSMADRGDHCSSAADIFRRDGAPSPA